MTTEKTKKNAKKFECDKCYFYTCKKTDLIRHLQTIKHKNNVLTTDNNGKNEKKHICHNCDKEFNDRAGLWRHNKKCSKVNITNEITDKELIVMLLKQNSQLIEQNAEFAKNSVNNNSHNINYNSNNKTFNLNLFLNETCKDAMNIMDFVDSIKLQLSDLETVGKIGYVEGISNIINKNLKALDVTQRPVHCTDKKREVLYIKDENKWEKENETKTKIRKAIKHIAHKNSKLISAFKDLHPDCVKSISKYSDQFNKIVIEAMGGQGDNDMEKEDKIIANISKNIIIDKEQK
jgi:hypothetical protein